MEIKRLRQTRLTGIALPYTYLKSLLFSCVKNCVSYFQNANRLSLLSNSISNVRLHLPKTVTRSLLFVFFLLVFISRLKLIFKHLYSFHTLLIWIHFVTVRYKLRSTRVQRENVMDVPAQNLASQNRRKIDSITNFCWETHRCWQFILSTKRRWKRP